MRAAGTNVFWVGRRAASRPLLPAGGIADQ
ncbi:hypothetical protein W822_08325 [Advenella kashmirensis W13003]|uniref:Uncharacterized protein n=1 Tax=Advenella kashmirensis W13003 TaxID=1424334 RepID=V8QVX8_9BURK|nr:hypothetical protein W822_08325 [Advenella kashmirensis W13003]